MKFSVLLTLLIIKLQLHAQIGAIANDELSVVYKGYDNIITAGAFGLPTSTKVFCDGCSSFTVKSPGKYIARVPLTAKEIKIRIQGSGLGMSKRFRVVSLPRPRCFVAGTDPFNFEISRTQLVKGTLTVQLIGSPLAMPIKLASGNITITVDGVSKSYPLDENGIPKNAKQIISLLRPGASVSIEPKVTMGNKTFAIPAVNYHIK